MSLATRFRLPSPGDRLATADGGPRSILREGEGDGYVEVDFVGVCRRRFRARERAAGADAAEAGQDLKRDLRQGDERRDEPRGRAEGLA
jgi:hypothetical protein